MDAAAEAAALIAGLSPEPIDSCMPIAHLFFRANQLFQLQRLTRQKRVQLCQNKLGEQCSGVLGRERYHRRLDVRRLRDAGKSRA